MGDGRKHPAAWRPADTSYQRYIHAARERGHGVDIHWQGIETYQRASEILRGLHRARRQLGESMSGEIYQERGQSFRVVFRLHDKQAARKFIRQAGRWNPPKG